MYVAVPPHDLRMSHRLWFSMTMTTRKSKKFVPAADAFGMTRTGAGRGGGVAPAKAGGDTTTARSNVNGIERPRRPKVSRYTQSALEATGALKPWFTAGPGLRSRRTPASIIDAFDSETLVLLAWGAHATPGTPDVRERIGAD